MKLKIKVPGPYNNELHQAAEYQEGETLITGDAYGADLVKCKLAEQIFEDAPAPKAEKKSKKKSAVPEGEVESEEDEEEESSADGDEETPEDESADDKKKKKATARRPKNSSNPFVLQ